MWTTFWPDVLVAAIGASLTIGVGLATFLVQRKRTEDRLLRGLINDLHHRRALAQVAHIRRLGRARRLPDYHRVTRSVLDFKGRIKYTSESIRGDLNSQEQLSDMTRACNAYLEDSANDPNNYLQHLMTLKTRLSDAVRELSETSRSVHALEPGGAAF